MYLKIRKSYRVVEARRESKRPRILAAIPNTREVRLWPLAVGQELGFLAS